MFVDEIQDDRDYLAEELDNFQEIAKYLNPSPGEIPRLPGVDIFGFTKPLKGILGGDHLLYIDFNRRYDLARRIGEAERAGRAEVAEQLRRNRHRAGILLADVSGHRITDALVGAMLHQAFLLGASYELDRFGELTTRLFENINQRFFKTSGVNKYLTMLYGEISDDGRFRFISAGHPMPLVFSRQDGRFVRISRESLVSYPPVGMFPTSDDPDEGPHPSLHGLKKSYQVNEIRLLAPGDLLLLYTDGLMEHAEDRYFPGELERFLAEVAHRPAEEICADLWENMSAWARPTDDISYVVIKRLADAEAPSGADQGEPAP
jgi:serine phosphatase RsbU (regulator of sigma subunit)